MSDPNLQTMRSLDGQGDDDPGGSALGDWYQSIRDIPIGELSIVDLARSCRQKLHPDSIVPVAIRRLGENPLAGDLYDGDLLLALRNVPESFWLRSDDLRSKLSLILAALDKDVLDSETTAELEILRVDAHIN